MSFNLNNSVDFGRATQSAAGDATLTAAILLDKLRGVGKWQIDEASYVALTDERQVEVTPPARFHVFKRIADFKAGLSSAKTQAGRRKAVYKFPYLDGQTTNDLGRDGETHVFECIFHGANYIAGWNRLLAQLSDPRPGTLTHPVFGKITVVPKDWDITFQSDTRQAMTVTLTFIEHNFSIAEPGPLKVDSSLKGTLSRALAAIASFDNALTSIQATTTLTNTIKNQLSTLLNLRKIDFRAALIALNASFNNSGSVDIPGALPVQAGGLSSVGGEEEAQAVSVAISPNDPFRGTVGSGVEDPQVLTTSQAVNLVNTYRRNLNATLDAYVSGGLELDFYDDILALRQTGILLQAVVETAAKTSRPKVINYITPRVMSLREVAFANGLTPDEMVEIDQLNPSLDSVNYIEAGTLVQVPVSR